MRVSKSQENRNASKKSEKIANPQPLSTAPSQVGGTCMYIYLVIKRGRCSAHPRIACCWNHDHLKSRDA
jgi:hypothetical protein